MLHNIAFQRWIKWITSIWTVLPSRITTALRIHPSPSPLSGASQGVMNPTEAHNHVVSVDASGAVQVYVVNNIHSQTISAFCNELQQLKLN